tara:strand:+ start:557 stop:697 length:141 start_codon:yes stop_codon:yes gene_type:complete
MGFTTMKEKNIPISGFLWLWVILVSGAYVFQFLDYLPAILSLIKLQ